MQTVATAITSCTMGTAPAPLMVIPINFEITMAAPVATILDHIPLVNILPFGACTSLLNPTVVAATASAFGVLTPMPCVPMTLSPWLPGSSTVLLANKPTLNSTSMLMCTWGGVIKITTPGQTSVIIP